MTLDAKNAHIPYTPEISINPARQEKPTESEPIPFLDVSPQPIPPDIYQLLP